MWQQLPDAQFGLRYEVVSRGKKTRRLSERKREEIQPLMKCKEKSVSSNVAKAKVSKDETRAGKSVRAGRARCKVGSRGDI